MRRLRKWYLAFRMCLRGRPVLRFMRGRGGRKPTRLASPGVFWAPTFSRRVHGEVEKLHRGPAQPVCTLVTERNRAGAYPVVTCCHEETRHTESVFRLSGIFESAAVAPGHFHFQPGQQGSGHPRTAPSGINHGRYRSQISAVKVAYANICLYISHRLTSGSSEATAKAILGPTAIRQTSPAEPTCPSVLLAAIAPLNQYQSGMCISGT